MKPISDYQTLFDNGMFISCVTTYHRVLRKVIVAVHKVLTLSHMLMLQPNSIKIDARQSISELTKEEIKGI